MRRILPIAFLALLAAPAFAADRPTRGLRYPSLTPDGKSVVFDYRGDIWVSPVDAGSGVVRRLTIHEAQDTLPRVSPDGKQVAFSSARNGNFDLYVIDIAGGEPRQITFHSAPEILCDWSPDGKRLLFASSRDVDGTGRMDLYEVDVAGGTPRRITFDGAREGSYSSDGKHIVYVRGFNTIYQDDYSGSANYDIYVTDLAGGLPQRVTDTPGNERYPYFSKDDKTIYYVAEDGGVANFWSIPADAKPGTAGKKLTAFEGDDVNRPCRSWDGHSFVFERAGALWTTDLAAPKPEGKALNLRVHSDVRDSGIEIRTITSGGEQVSLSRDGTQMAFTLRGDIWMMPPSGGEGRRLTTGTPEDEWPRFSPDGTRIAFQSNAHGNSDIYILDLRTQKTQQVTRNAADDFFHAWAPDGKRLVFTSERSGNRDLWIVDLESGQETQLTNEPAADDDASFSPDGKWIVFDSAREGSQAIYVMPSSGGPARRVSDGAGYYQVPSFSPDGSMIVFEQYNPANGDSGGIFVTSFDGGAAVQVSADGQAACWSPKGDWIYFHATRNGEAGIWRVRAPEGITAGERVPFLGRIEVDVRKELGDLFDEAWTKLKDGFYDPSMHGVDWDKIKTKYRDMAIDTENKDEFYVVVSQMLAELKASHLGIGPGRHQGSRAEGSAPETGYLGADLEPTGTDGGRKVLSLLEKGPADAAGLRPGDVVTSVAGKSLKPDTDLDQVLAGTAGKEITVGFRPITDKGLSDERKVALTPVDEGRARALEYQSHIRTCEDRVKSESKGHAVYLHLSAMDPANLQKFQRAVQRYNANRDVQGLVLDVRENGGGNIHAQLMDVLLARPYIELQPRGAPQKIPQPQLYWDKPVVVLVNERSFSDAEVFPWCFQQAKRGKIVGVPTPGGVIGTNDITLADGSTFRIPRVGWYGVDGTRLEGKGVQPDVVVWDTPEDRREGRDPQLDRAIEVLMSEVDAAKPAAAKPETKPEAKPESKPPETKTPAPSPAPNPSAPGPKAPGPSETPGTAGALDPLADARVGEWVRYRAGVGPTGETSTGSSLDTVIKVSIASIENGKVTFKKEVESGGAFVPPMPDEVMQGPVLDGLSRFGTVSHHSIVQGDLKGETVEMLVVEIDMGGTPARMFFTNAVPCTGLLRVEWNKRTVLEATEWGYEAPAPASSAPAGATQSGSPVATAHAAPASPGPVDPGSADAPANPLYDAEVGEWIRFKNRVQGEDTVVLQEVIEVTADEVVLKTSVRHGTTVIQGDPIRRPRTKTLALRRGGQEATVERETTTVNGREVACSVLTTHGRRGGTVKQWVSDEVAATGLVRRERDGEVVSEVIDWGRPGTVPSEP